MNDVNSKIATLIMGWHKNGVWWEDGNTIELLGTGEIGVDYFDPIHRIEYAWMVVEKIESRKFIIERKYDRWLCNIQDKTGKWFDVDPQATAQEAICLAALKAKEVENE
jgi:hypothetical protein